MDAIDLLLQRNSHGKLTSPAPDKQQLEIIQQAALRAPDHGQLRPWRFLVLDNQQALTALGELFLQALLKREPNASEDKRQKTQAMPLRAPLMIIALANCESTPKNIPRDEKIMSTAAACEAILLACHAQGYAAMWRTGVNAEDETVREGLALSSDELIAGFIYIGTAENNYKPLPQHASHDFFSSWPN